MRLDPTRRARVASSVLLRARGSCESRVSDPSLAAQGDRTRSRTNTTPYGTEASAAGEMGCACVTREVSVERGKEIRLNARLIKLAVIPRAWSSRGSTRSAIDECIKSTSRGIAPGSNRCYKSHKTRTVYSYNLEAYFPLYFILPLSLSRRGRLVTEPANVQPNHKRA